MAAAQNPNVHLEAVEEAENEDSQFKKAGDTGRQGIQVGKYQIGLLAHSGKSSAIVFHYQ